MEIEFFLVLFLSILLVSTLAATLVKFVNIPYSIVLVIVGLIITALNSQGIFEVLFGSRLVIKDIFTKEFIFMLMLPPLLFEGALAMNLEHLRENLRIIVTLAIPGVLVSTFVTGGLVYLIIGQFIGLDIMVCLLFGAMISPTDPISVLSLFKKLGAPKRLSNIIEGESLFNDGTGVVIFGIILAIIGSNNSMGDTYATIGMGVVNFLVVTSSGLALGTVLGFAAYKFLGQVDDHLIEVTVTFILSFGVYMAAEIINQGLQNTFHTEYEWVSGVLAVVAAGLIIGNYGTMFSMSASTRVALDTFWDFMTFIVNSILFVLIGMQIHLDELWLDAGWIVVAIAIVILTRALVIYVASAFLNRLRSNVPLSWQHVMIWGGLRGAIPIALILGFILDHSQGPVMEAWVNSLSHIVFGVVLFSLVIQGLSMEPLLKRFGMIGQLDKEIVYEGKIGQAIAARAAIREIEDMHERNEISDPVYNRMAKKFERKSKRLSKDIITFLQSEEVINAQQQHHASRRSLIAMKSAVMDASKRGVISKATAENLLTGFDIELDDLRP